MKLLQKYFTMMYPVSPFHDKYCRLRSQTNKFVTLYLMYGITNYFTCSNSVNYAIICKKTRI